MINNNNNILYLDKSQRKHLGKLLARDENHPSINSIAVEFQSNKFLGGLIFIVKELMSDNSDIRNIVSIFTAIIHTNQFFLLSSSDGNPKAFIMWGWLSDKTLKCRSRNSVHQLHRFEINEGNNLCLLLSAGCKSGQKLLLDKWINDIAKDEVCIYVLDFLSCKSVRRIETINWIKERDGFVKTLNIRHF